MKSKFFTTFTFSRSKVLALLSLVIYNLSFSQPNSPGGGVGPAGSVTTPGGQPCFDPQCIPVDGGLVFLLVAGALLGVAMIVKLNKKAY